MNTRTAAAVVCRFSQAKIGAMFFRFEDMTPDATIESLTLYSKYDTRTARKTNRADVITIDPLAYIVVAQVSMVLIDGRKYVRVVVGEEFAVVPITCAHCGAGVPSNYFTCGSSACQEKEYVANLARVKARKAAR